MIIAYGNNTLTIRKKGVCQSSSVLDGVFAQLREGNDVELECCPRSLAEYLNENYPMVRAAGGIITNGEGRRLMIHRRGCWDLPKGKQDDGESLWTTALREVAEETGLHHVAIDDIAGKTYHIHNRYGSWVLKQVTWFYMHTTADGELLVPQAEEEIGEAVWATVEEWREAMRNSFATLRLLSNK